MALADYAITGIAVGIDLTRRLWLCRQLSGDSRCLMLVISRSSIISVALAVMNVMVVWAWLWILSASGVNMMG